jgi:hypothetical protein
MVEMPPPVHQWVPLPEVLWPPLLPVPAGAQRPIGPLANCWVVLACSRLRKVCSPVSLVLFHATDPSAAEAIDQWFENLQNYEATLEEMAAASLDVNFKEELSAIEQCKSCSSTFSIHYLNTCISGFKVLSEAERTAALYSLLQHSTQVQIRFFITVLQQMARSDPMTALLSPAMGGTPTSTFFLPSPLCVSRVHAEPNGSQTRKHESQVPWAQVWHAVFPVGTQL